MANLDVPDILLKLRFALAGVARLVGVAPMHQKGGGFHSGQVTCPDWRFDPRWGRLWEAGDRCFSNTLRFLPYLSTGGVDVRSHRRRYLRPGEGAVAQSRLTRDLVWPCGAQAQSLGARTRAAAGEGAGGARGMGASAREK